MNWTHWLSYSSFTIVVATTLLLEYWIQEALKIYPANYVNPIYLTFTVILTIVFAALYFEEFDGMSNLHIHIFGIAVFVSFVGVAMIAFGERKNANKREEIKRMDDDDDDDDEQTFNAEEFSTNDYKKTDLDFTGIETEELL